MSLDSLGKQSMPDDVCKKWERKIKLQSLMENGVWFWEFKNLGLDSVGWSYVDAPPTPTPTHPCIITQHLISIPALNSLKYFMASCFVSKAKLLET